MHTTTPIGASVSAVYQQDSNTRTAQSGTANDFAKRLAVAGQAAEPAAKTAAPGLVSASSRKPEDIKLAFRAWQTDYFKKGIGEERRQQVQAAAAGYEQVIDKAATQAGYADPKKFLQSLSPTELTAVQHIHCLADPIQPANLSEEGALNLLQSPDQTLDIDHDGFQMVGLAKTWRFPPVDAPEGVKKAWKTATENLSDADVMLLEGSFLPLSIEGKTAQNAAYLGPDANYSQLVQRVIEGAEFSRKFDEPWQRETRDRQIALLKAFLDQLESISAAA